MACQYKTLVKHYCMIANKTTRSFNMVFLGVILFVITLYARINILRYELWYDHVKLKYQDKAKLSCMDTDSLIIHI